MTKTEELKTMTQDSTKPSDFGRLLSTGLLRPIRKEEMDLVAGGVGTKVCVEEIKKTIVSDPNCSVDEV